MPWKYCFVYSVPSLHTEHCRSRQGPCVNLTHLPSDTGMPKPQLAAARLPALVARLPSLRKSILHSYIPPEVAIYTECSRPYYLRVHVDC